MAKVIYTDENPKMKAIAKYFDENSLKLLSLKHIKRFCMGKGYYSDKVDNNKVLDHLELQILVAEFNCQLVHKVTDSKFTHGIGNNLGKYVYDNETHEHIGIIGATNGIYGGVYATCKDINYNNVSKCFYITENGAREDN